MRETTARALKTPTAPLRRQGRRPLARIRRHAAKAPTPVTVGALIAAAFEVVGDDPRAVEQLLRSPEFARLTAGKLEII